jgi:hypothetical protein
MKVSFCKHTTGQQACTQPRILLHRETMAGGERENEDIGVEKFHEGIWCDMTGEVKWKQLNCE